ncbi:MAG TPA: hypothetical protein VHS31_20185 [Tepidisphaeraceae bacterium]|jgi:hypothetical protein|nr:hypothetical protein [Tepidisphaeraceae bacterium]
MPKPDPDYDATEGESTLKGVILPCILIGVAFFLRIGFAIYTHSSAGESVGLVCCQLIISLFVMLIGCATAAAWMNLNIGPIDRAVLKLCATSLCAGAIGTLIAATGPRSSIPSNLVAWHAVVLCYLILFAIFFSSSLGIQETFVTVFIVVLMQLAVSFALANFLGIGQPMALFYER